MASKRTFKPPKSLAQCADLLFTTRQTRLQIEQQVDELKAQELQLKEKLIAELPKGEATGIAGKLARVSIIPKTTPQVDTEHDGWDKLHRFIVKNDAWDLLQRRITEKAVQARWDNGVEVPGVIPVPYFFVSINKV